MRFNAIKGLLSSVLFCAFYVNAQEYSDGCNRLRKISEKDNGSFTISACKEGHYGYIHELQINIHSTVAKNIFNNYHFEDLRKLYIDDTSNGELKQYNLDELADTNERIKELHISSKNDDLDISVFKNHENLEYLDLRNFASKINLDGFKDLERLNILDDELTQSMINSIGKLPNLQELYFEINDNSRKYNFKPLKNIKTLTTLFLQGEASDSRYYGYVESGTLRGFNNLKELFLKKISLDDGDIDDISTLSKLQELTFKTCTFNYSEIDPLNKLPNLRSIKFLDCGAVNGKTLSNSKLESCRYDIDFIESDLCIDKKLECLERYESKLELCDNSNGNISTNGRCGPEYGRCPSDQCCSQYGYCGTTDAYCGKGCQSEFGNCKGSTTTVTRTTTTTRAPLPTSTDDRCGPQYGTRCPAGECCSKHNWCGTSSDHCGSGCQSEFGRCN